MLISNFEQRINPVILDRGIDYWKSDLVSNLHWEDNTVTATVRGSSLYEVEIEFAGEEIKDVYCNCPYDWDDCCKHVVAVLLAVKHNGLPEPNSKRLKELLKDMSEDDMRKLLLEILLKEPRWHEQVLARNASETNEIFNRYDAILKNHIASCSDRHGFIDYYRAADVGIIGDELLSEARALIIDDEFEQALAICKAVLINMIEAIAEADDSNGYIGGAAKGAILCLAEITTSQDVPRETADRLFEIITDVYFLSKFTDFDWHYELMEIAVGVADTKEREQRLFNAAVAFTDNNTEGFLASYSREWYKRLRLTFLQNFASPMEAEQFIDNNLDVSSFRKLKLEKLYKNKQYDHVIRLAREGTQKDHAYRGLLCNWLEWVLKGAEGKKDLELQQEVLRQLYSEFHDIKYFKMLKLRFSPANWIDIRNEILATPDMSWREKAEILIEEKMFEDLWRIVTEKRSLDVLTSYDHYLLPQYSNEIRSHYLQLIPESLSRVQGRKHYQLIAGIISSREKSLGTDFRNELVDLLLQLYPNRPAMKDEFRKAGLL